MYKSKFFFVGLNTKIYKKDKLKKSKKRNDILRYFPLIV